MIKIKYCLEFEKLEREETMEVPPKPPQKRNWRGGDVAPFGGNNALVLYHCPLNNATTKYFVQVLHNEQPMPMAVRFFFHLYGMELYF